MHKNDDAYSKFLVRLKQHERLEPLPKPRDDTKLAGMKMLLEQAGHPERAYRIIHVAGTNGKGLTSVMIGALLSKSGLKVGVNTSPHLVDLRERISIAEAMIEPALLTDVGTRILNLAEAIKRQVHLSYFDIMTAIALAAFQEAGVQWAVLETGLGGRYDATNTTPKELCVITRIGMDHQHILGDSLEAIAGEKLGICRPGIPVVLGRQQASLTPMMEASLARLDAPVKRAWDIELQAPQTGSPEVIACWPDGERVHYSPAKEAPEGTEPESAPGSAPFLQCAANALAAAEVILGAGDSLERQNRLAAVMEVKLPGRLDLRHHQRISTTGAEPDSKADAKPGPQGKAGPKILEQVLLDGGHNAEAVQALNDRLAQLGIGGYNLLLSLQKDKLVQALRPPLAQLLSGAARVMILSPGTIRAPSEQELRAYLDSLQLRQKAPVPADPPVCYETPLQALLAAAETPETPLVVAGSFWTVGEVLRMLQAD